MALGLGDNDGQSWGNFTPPQYKSPLPCEGCKARDAHIKFLEGIFLKSMEQQNIMMNGVIDQYKPSNQTFEPKQDENLKMKINGKDPDGNEINQVIDFSQEVLGH